MASAWGVPIAKHAVRRQRDEIGLRNVDRSGLSLMTGARSAAYAASSSGPGLRKRGRS
jgi:hypothetical protein